MANMKSKTEMTLINILEILRKKNLEVKIVKTNSFANEIKYLGHTIDKNGCRPSERNIAAIKDVAKPKNEKEVQRSIEYSSKPLNAAQRNYATTLKKMNTLDYP